jgi:Uma2 family endonuclease
MKFYTIDRENRDRLNLMKFNGEDLINPPVLQWSNYGDEGLMDLLSINFKIKEENGKFTHNTITICVGAYDYMVKDFLLNNAVEVSPTIVLLIWEFHKDEIGTIGSLPIDIVKKILCDFI